MAWQPPSSPTSYMMAHVRKDAETAGPLKSPGTGIVSLSSYSIRVKAVTGQPRFKEKRS